MLVEVFSAMISSRVIVLIGSSLFLSRNARVAFTCIMIESRFNLARISVQRTGTRLKSESEQYARRYVQCAGRRQNIDSFDPKKVKIRRQ